MRKSFQRMLFLIAVILLGISSNGEAQMLVAPQLKSGVQQLTLIPSLSFSDVDYHFDHGGTTDVERTILGIAGSYGLDKQLDLYGELGFSARSKLDSGDDGQGLLLGGGVKGLFYERGKLSILGLAGVRYLTEDYGGGRDGQFFEVPLALIFRGQLQPEIGIYGGVDVLPWTDGEIDGGRGSSDLERDDVVGLRLGADYRIERIILNAEVSLISEESFLLRLAIPM